MGPIALSFLSDGVFREGRIPLQYVGIGIGYLLEPYSRPYPADDPLLKGTITIRRKEIVLTQKEEDGGLSAISLFLIVSLFWRKKSYTRRNPYERPASRRRHTVPHSTSVVPSRMIETGSGVAAITSPLPRLVLLKAPLAPSGDAKNERLM